MTDPTDSPRSKPISVAELLAKNGNIGSSPPVGGRRRRRRGATDSISVAELTGEIPIYTDDVPPVTGEVPTVTDDIPDPPDPAPVSAKSGLLPVRKRTPEERARGSKTKVDIDAEQMSPDLDIEHPDVLDDILDVDQGADVVPAEPDAARSYVRSDGGALFGGRTDDGMHQGLQAFDEVEHPSDKRTSPILAGAWVVGQCILAVVFGAGLFIAFDQLWQWNNIVALVLSVLVILGLVVGVRVVRKTEDIASTLIAVAVGAMVTLGPLALLRSH